MARPPLLLTDGRASNLREATAVDGLGFEALLELEEDDMPSCLAGQWTVSGGTRHVIFIFIFIFINPIYRAQMLHVVLSDAWWDRRVASKQWAVICSSRLPLYELRPGDRRRRGDLATIIRRRCDR